MNRLLLATAAVVLLLPGLPQAAALPANWSIAPGGTPDGIALAELDGDRGREAAVVLRGGSYYPGAVTPGLGSLAAIDQNGALLWQYTSTTEMVGFPAAGDLDGDGRDEIVACENDWAAFCRALDDNGTPLFAIGPLFYPGMTNGGPALADLNGDGLQDVIVLSFGGEIAAVAGPTGAPLWNRDLFNEFGELLFTSPVLGDLNGDGVPDLVVGGYQNGGVYAIDATSGASLWTITNLSGDPVNPAPGNVVHVIGNGAVLSDLDGDGRDEVVLPVAGSAVSAVVAIDDNGTVLWWTQLVGAQLGYTAPLAVDSDGNGSIELFVQSLDGMLYRLAANGSILSQTRTGTKSWTGPAPVDLNLDGAIDVVATNYGGLEVIDGGLSAIAHSYNEPAAGMWLAPLQADIDNDGTIELLTGGWLSRSIVALDLAEWATWPWVAPGGTPQHPGSLEADNPAQRFGDRIVHATQTVLNITDAFFDQPGISGADKKAYDKEVRKELEKAVKEFVKGKPHKNVDKLKKAIEKLNDKISVDTTALQQQIFDVALLGLDQILARTTAILGPNHTEVLKAQQLRASAIALAAQGDWEKAADALKKAAEVEKYIDKIMKDYEDGKIADNTAWQGNFCGAGGEPYLASQCQMQTVLDQVTQLAAANPGDSDLARAVIAIRDGVTWQSILKLQDAADYFIDAAEDLLDASVDTSPQLAAMTEAFRFNVRTWLDDAARYWPAGSKELASAESLYQTAIAAQAAGDFEEALDTFKDVLKAAKP